MSLLITSDPDLPVFLKTALGTLLFHCRISFSRSSLFPHVSIPQDLSLFPHGILQGSSQSHLQRIHYVLRSCPPRDLSLFSLVLLQAEFIYLLLGIPRESPSFPIVVYSPSLGLLFSKGLSGFPFILPLFLLDTQESQCPLVEFLLY